MLYYDFKSVMAAKGVENPYTWLKRKGFTHYLAGRIAANKAQGLSTNQLEKLCIVLGCTPHDLLVWKPSEGQNGENHPLKVLQRKHQPSRIKQLMKGLTLNEMKAMEAALLKLRKEGEKGKALDD